LPALGDHFLDRSAIAPKRMEAAVNDNLRRIDLAVRPQLRIGALARGIAWLGERVLPAKIIPVIDRQAYRYERRIVCKFTQQAISRRT
jgi:hypothetical protein